MKTFLLCISLILTGALHAQDKTKKTKNDTLLTLNFKTKKLEGFENFKPRRDRTYNFQVTHINMNVYKLVINKTDTVVSAPLDFSAFSMLDPSGLSNLFTGITHATSVLIKNTDEIEEFTRNIKSDTSNTNSDKGLEDLVEKTLNDNINKFAVFAKQLKDSTEKFEKAYNQTINYFKRANLLTESSELSYGFVEKFIPKMESFRSFIDSSIVTGKKNTIAFKKFMQVDSVELVKKKLFWKADTLRSSMDSLNIYLDSISKAVSLENTNKLIAKFADIINNSRRTYISLPLQFNGDKSKLDISIIPQDKESRLPSYHTTYLLPKPSGFYIGIGPGLYYSNLYDDRFSTVGFAATDSTTNYRMISEKQSRNEIGLSVLLKAGWKLRQCDRVGFHGTIGGGLSFTDPLRLRALYGGGISIGEKHCLTLDILGSTGYVDVQSNTVSEQTIFTEKPESMTVSVLRTKLAFSVGYLFTF